MRNLRIILGTACLLTVAGARIAVAASPHAQIQRQIDAMAAAANAHNAGDFLKPFTHGPRLVFVINGQVIRGWNALHAAQLKWWRNGASDARYTQISPVSFMDVAPGVVITTQQLESQRTGPDGKTQKGTFAVSTVWRRQRHGWRIAYASESWAR
jgi:ketosteroid isomerase-like protein